MMSILKTYHCFLKHYLCTIQQIRRGRILSCSSLLINCFTTLRQNFESDLSRCSSSSSSSSTEHDVLEPTERKPFHAHAQHPGFYCIMTYHIPMDAMHASDNRFCAKSDRKRHVKNAFEERFLQRSLVVRGFEPKPRETKKPQHKTKTSC